MIREQVGEYLYDIEIWKNFLDKIKGKRKKTNEYDYTKNYIIHQNK